MKFDTAPAFDNDVRRLKKGGEFELFRDAVHEDFIPAAERRVAEPSSRWPARLRIKRVESAPGVLEMTWNFKQPDGRATWEWIEVGGESAVRWRRVGDRSIFKDP